MGGLSLSWMPPLASHSAPGEPGQPGGCPTAHGHLEQSHLPRCQSRAGGGVPPGSRLGDDGWGCWWVAGRRSGLESTTMDVSPSICPHYHANGGREGEEGHVAAGETPHMLPSGAACRSPQPSSPERVKPAPTRTPPAPNSGEERYHPPFRALKRLQGPALLTRGDAVPVPASPVCPSLLGLLPWPRQPAPLPAPGWHAGCRGPGSPGEGDRGFRKAPRKHLLFAGQRTSERRGQEAGWGPCGTPKRSFPRGVGDGSGQGLSPSPREPRAQPCPHGLGGAGD